MSRGTTDWQYAERLHQLRLARGNKCERRSCGKKGRWRKYRSGRRDYTLQFAHVVATLLRGRGRGVRRRFLDIRDNPQCYVLLCTMCHRAFDRERMNAA